MHNQPRGQLTKFGTMAKANNVYSKVLLIMIKCLKTIFISIGGTIQTKSEIFHYETGGIKSN